MSRDVRSLRIAVVHEWFASYAGSERVIEQILAVYPHADVFAVVDFLDPAERAFLGGRKPVTTFIQRLPGSRKRFRSYLPLMPLAIEQLDLSGYDIVISSSHAVAKGVITGPDQLHVSYVHSPMRYAWDLQGQYLAEAGLTRGVRGGIARAVLHYMRIWDSRTSNGVDSFVANSAYVARRVRKAYGRTATVIHPPVDVSRFVPGGERDDFYLTVSRMVPYKMVPLIVEAFSSMPTRRLVVIGDGPDLARAQRLAGSNVEILAPCSTEALVSYMQRARAFVFAAEEDFGIAMVEAQACGTPVIAFGRGGAVEAVRGTGDSGRRTGVFFGERTVASIAEAVDRFEATPPFDAAVCREHAQLFGVNVFRERFAAHVAAEWQRFSQSPGSPES
jgi:glycosyltransferase involved in cell wall biosynthesis